jgi:nucleoside-diphosphate-sugar epimerase
VDARGTERVVAAARAAGATRLAYVSGAGAAPDAARHWFRAKWRAEEAVRASGIPWTIVRPTWVYGPRDVALNRFVGFARQLPFVPMTNTGRQLLAPVFVEDVARLIADALVGTPVLPDAGTSNAWLGALGIVMTVVYASSIVIRSKGRYAGFGLDSILNTLIYGLGLIGLVQIAS